MTQLEYKVMPAPARGIKARGLKTPEARFAHAMEILLNDMASEGWRYERAETLPSEERQGLTGTQIGYRNLLVFSRPAHPGQEADAPTPMLSAPDAASDEEAEAIRDADEVIEEAIEEARQDDDTSAPERP